MSFFHVLPSNVAPESFPRNNASAFSTPIANSYHLDGKWEVALLNMTYSGCINTFHHDKILVEKTFRLKEKLLTSDTPIRVDFTGDTIGALVDDMKKKLDGVIKLFLYDNAKICRWTVLIPNVTAILSKPLMRRFVLSHDVLTSWDAFSSNHRELNEDKIWEDMDYHIIIFPPTYEKTTITLKEENEEITPKEFIQRFDKQLQNYLHIEDKSKRFTVTKLHDDNTVIIFSPTLHQMTNLRQAGFYERASAHHLEYDFSNSYRNIWQVSLFQPKDVQLSGDKMTIPITLLPKTFQNKRDAVVYLNGAVNNSNIKFSLDKNNILQLKIDDDKTSVTFSKTLQDIFAFDHNTYTGKGLFAASGSFSLARRIHFLYVYSSVSAYVRIGDTEAPLLAVIPFNPEVCVDLLLEKTFKTPMYVPVIQNPISQIDIAIYDGAGEMVPFTSDAVTSLRLHFRQL